MLLRSGVKLDTVRVFVGKSGPQYNPRSLKPIWHEIIARTRAPTGDALSVLQYLHVLCKQAVVVWPSIARAEVELVSMEGDKVDWMLEHGLHRDDPSNAVDEHSVFSLRIPISRMLSGMHSKVGSHLGAVHSLSFELSLRPKASFIKNAANQQTHEKFTDTISFAKNKMMDGVRRELLRRKLTSNMSLIEAAAQSLERNFCSSNLNRYFELKGARIFGRSKQHSWAHERCGQDAAFPSTSIGKHGLLNADLCPPTSPPATANHEYPTSVCMLESKPEQ
jgi:hypothetical protein